MFKTNTSGAEPRRSKMGRFALAAAIGLTLAQMADAQNIRPNIGGSERINMAGQLSTLSQRIIASACNLDAGIALVESDAVLQISTNQFDRISDALLFGNRGFGILGEETRAQTLQAIASLNGAWGPLQTRAVQVKKSANDPVQIAEFADQSGPLLDTADVLVSEISGQYADPVALLHADALLIDLAARQRMRAAQMSKDVCLIASGITSDTAKADLAKTITLFDDTLSALRNGLDSVGIRPPPTQQIADGLQFVAEEWTLIQPSLALSLSGETLDDDTRQRLFLAFLGMEARMNNVVVMYGKNSKL